MSHGIMNITSKDNERESKIFIYTYIIIKRILQVIIVNNLELSVLYVEKHLDKIFYSNFHSFEILIQNWSTLLFSRIKNKEY